MSTTEYALWIGVALVQWIMLSTIYKENPFYDIVEGLSLGATVGMSIMDNWNNLQNLVLRPIYNQPSTSLWVVIALIWGLLYFTRYFRRLIEVFRFLTAFSLAISVALSARTVAATGWAQVTGSVAQLKDFNGFIVWLFFIGGMFYYVFGKKLGKPLAPVLVFGRWVMIWTIGALLTPMGFRYFEAGITWSIQINNSPAWWIPFAVFAIIVVDALNDKYRFFGKAKQIEAQRTT